MATLASARPVPHAPIGRSPVVREPVPMFEARDRAPEDGPAPLGFERAIYQPSRRAGPVAFVASAAVLLAVGAALATLNIVGQHQKVSRLTVVSLKELDTTPPPPPPPAKTLDQPAAQQQVSIPKPRIVLPAPGPTQVAVDLPPVRQVVALAPPVAAPPVAAAAPAIAPPASSGPVDGGDLSSQVISARPPVYPVDARRKKIQGTVRLRVLVGPDGRVSDLQIAVSSGSDLLDKAAMKAVRQWRWTPQKQNGTPVAVRGTVPVTFALG